MKFAYYPGCTQETTAWEYNQSVLEVCQKLGIELIKIPDWNCCGASSGHSTDYWLSHALSGRNLAIAEKEGMDIAVSCPACYLRLNATRHEFRNGSKLKERLPSLINMPYHAKYEVRHILDIIYNTKGVEVINRQVIKPLAGLKVVSYYGCYLVRPPELTCFDDSENPQTMDIMLKALGAEVPDWSAKVDCCGGSLSFTGKETVKYLVLKIKDAAREVGAEAIVTACPLCQANLETRQSGQFFLPVFFLTELMGLALGCNVKPWIKRHLTNPTGLLKKHKLL